jgi:hypothetical protein
MAQTAECLAKLAANLGLSKPPANGLPGWPSELPQQVAKESLRG